ncbi:MAG: hypothetical protein ACTJHZ_05285, partial [Vagococcus sp.]
LDIFTRVANLMLQFRKKINFGNLKVIGNPSYKVIHLTSKKLIVPFHLSFINQITDNILLIEVLSERVFILKFKNYKQLSQRYRMLASLVNDQSNFSILILECKNFNQLSFNKFEQLLQKKILYLEKKTQHIYPQISNSENTLAGYYQNLEEHSDILTEEQFKNHEIPQEEFRLNFLRNFHKTSIHQKETFEKIYLKTFFIKLV